MKNFTLLGGAVLLALPVLATPPTTPRVRVPMATNTVEFVANRRQWSPAVLFATDVPAGRLYLEHGRLVQARYDGKRVDELQHHADKTRDYQVNAHAYTTTFVGASPQAAVRGEAQLPGYSNFFLGSDQAHWASQVPSFGGVRYQGLYPGVDLHFYGKGQALEYDFEVAAGADAGRIALRYDGQSSLAVVDGALRIGTSVGTVVEQQPVAYQIVGGQRRRVACAYVLGPQHTVSFRLPQGYNHALPLIIDPVLVYSTYTGSTASNYGFTATYDSLGNVYSGGNVFSAGYPTTVGAYSTSYKGGTDMGLIKYNPNATTGAASRVYATYLGGSSSEEPHSLIVDRLNNLIVMGTTSSANYPTTTGAYKTTLGGTQDIVLTKLSSNGAALLGSTYLGGTSTDGYLNSASLWVNYGDYYRGDLAVDAAGNIYTVGVTASANFPTTAGVAQATYGGGTYDGVVCKLNASLTGLTWSTFLGGSGDDAVYSMQLDGSGNVFVSGGTTSANLAATTGAYQPAYAGAVDGFLTRLTSTGALVRTTYLGTAAYDQAYLIQLDTNGDVYTFGQTAGAYPVSAGVYSNPGSRQFLHKLNGQLTTSVFSTVIGNGATNSPCLSPTALSVTDCGQILLSGWTLQSGFPTTAGALQATVSANTTNTTANFSGWFYIAQLSANASALTYGTYFGTGTCHVDGGTSRFDKKGNIYQSMCVGYNGLTTTANAWSATNGGGYNNATFKMDVAPLSAAFIPSLTLNGPRQQQACAPQRFYFGRSATNGTASWDFGNGQTATNTNSTSMLYTTPGAYAVRLTVTDNAAGCLQTISSVDTVKVFGLPQAAAGPDKTICLGSSTALTVASAGTGATYQWSPATGLSSTTGATVQASPTVTTQYIVRVTVNGCTGADTVRVIVAPLPSANAGPAQTICPGASATLAVPNAGTGATYQWSPATGLSSTTGATVQASPTATTQYTVTVTTASGCTSTGTVQVNVSSPPSVNTGPTQTICPGSSATLTVASAGTGATYQWSPATGLSSTTGATVQASPTATTQYTVRVTTASGCTSTGTVQVVVAPLPSANAGPAQTICPGSTATLAVPNAGTGATYQWSPAIGLSSTTGATVQASPTATTQYTVTVTTASGCTSTGTVQVAVAPLPSASAGPNQTICPGSSATLTVPDAGPGATYQWSPAAGLSSATSRSVQASPTATTQYTVRVTTASGCTSTGTVSVTTVPAPQIAIQASLNSVLPKTPIKFTTTASAPVTAYQWNFGDAAGTSTAAAPSYAYAEPGTYQVRLTVTFGSSCTESVVLPLIVRQLELPNVITPNADGKNDTFRPDVSDGQVSIVIYNRWGRQVYEQQHYTGNWGAEPTTAPGTTTTN